MKSDLRYLLTIITIMICATSASGGGVALSCECDSQRTESGKKNTQWVRTLIRNDFNVNDTAISYPPGVKKLIDVYNWADRVFNSYDSTYVVGTGKKWKAMVKSYNWIDHYMFLFSLNPKDMMSLRSEMYSDIGFHLSFMAVSIGYTAKLNSLFGGADKNTRRNFNFNFTCSRVYGNFDYTYTDGESIITGLGDYNKDKLNYRFYGVAHRAIMAEAYYIFNYSKFSQAAAYCYSKYQLKSAGSWVCGLSLNHQIMDLNFNSLPDDMFESLPQLAKSYRFRYCDYGVLGGYLYNWAIRPRRWLMNFGVLPSMGYRHSYSTSSEGRKNMVSTNVRLMYGLVYNHRSFFASLSAKYTGHFYYNKDYAFVNGLGVIQVSAGARF